MALANGVLLEVEYIQSVPHVYLTLKGDLMWFTVDTGSPGSCISRLVVKLLGLEAAIQPSGTISLPVES